MTPRQKKPRRRKQARHDRGLRLFAPLRKREVKRHDSPREQLSLFDQDKIEAALRRMDELGL